MKLYGPKRLPILRTTHESLATLQSGTRMYRKSGPRVPKVRLTIDQKNRIAGSLSLSHRNTLMSLLHSSMTAKGDHRKVAPKFWNGSSSGVFLLADQFVAMVRPVASEA